MDDKDANENGYSALAPNSQDSLHLKDNLDMPLQAPHFLVDCIPSAVTPDKIHALLEQPLPSFNLKCAVITQRFSNKKDS